ncbi:MAG: aldehyde dehydrogenase family protein [Pseudomonadales bacterium]|nr:aldehyde dehydrogenase family protein [Pseudomonadales bacterium]
MSNSFETISPVDGSVVTRTDYSSSEEIEAKLNAAKAVADSWRDLSISERAVVCRKALDYFERNKESIAAEITQQMGRPIKYSAGEVAGLQERGSYMIDIAEECLRDIEVPEQAGFKRYIRREPLGTVLVLAPWNYPYLTAVNTIIPALMAGNSVILKHSAQTPICAQRFKAAFEAAGLPAGVFDIVNLTHQQVDEVIRSPKINYVAFTGSVNGGACVEESASGRFIGVGLELGGKDPAYVRSDADLGFAIENLVDGAFFNSGQSCCGIERIYVHRDLYQNFIDGFAKLTADYVLGNPTDPDTTLGPVVSKAAATMIQQQIEAAIDMGAKALVDSQPFQDSIDRLGSQYMAPQVLVDVNHDMAVMTEETFGPVVGIMPVDSDEQAIDLMNDSPYGLTASLWTRDLETAEALGKQIQTGTVFMNRCDYLDPALVWTGVKNTGRGGTLSALGYESLTQPKSFHLRLPA